MKRVEIASLVLLMIATTSHAEDGFSWRNSGNHLMLHFQEGAFSASSRDGSNTTSDKIAMRQLEQLRQINTNTQVTATRVSSIGTLATSIKELTEQVRILNEEQLVAIQRAVVTRLDTLPLQMIDDEGVIEEIRRIAIEAVETEFRLARDSE